MTFEHLLMGDKQIRELTPLECERLQGLPDNFTKFYSDNSLVKDNERRERCGRTVTIPIIKSIGERLWKT
jgi:DNA (cytosine-5)-methyltransferase 1